MLLSLPVDTSPTNDVNVSYAATDQDYKPDYSEEDIYLLNLDHQMNDTYGNATHYDSLDDFTKTSDLTSDNQEDSYIFGKIIYGIVIIVIVISIGFVFYYLIKYCRYHFGFRQLPTEPLIDNEFELRGFDYIV